ncbi:MAG: SDR family oxidoreductase [Gammaproteobacteria bacterium]|nr:SDR family oxidoreductase [Gammaproteobacteria bacterium]
MSDPSLEGKVAVVTGAGQGMGRAATRLLSERGAAVAALDLNEAGSAETIAGLTGRSLALHCDVSASAAVNEAFDRVEAELGPVSVLVNNAGIGRAEGDGSDRMYELMAQRNAELEAGGEAEIHIDHIVFMEDQGWRGVMGVNLDGAFHCARAAVRSMVKAGIAGSIINISSTAAQSGEGPIHYVTSKAALVGLTRGLARELGSRRIRVNAVAPGPTNTHIMDGIPEAWIRDMESAIPLGRMAEPGEIAQAVCWLASDASSMCTGSVLVANGGSYFF